MSTWRERMRPAIRRVIEAHWPEGEKVIRARLRETWDEAGMGPRSMHPYKAWCAEVKEQLRRRSPEGLLAEYQEMIEEQPDRPAKKGGRDG